eukprot:1357181-Amphidinium_carterae.1
MQGECCFAEEGTSSSRRRKCATLSRQAQAVVWPLLSRPLSSSLSGLKQQSKRHLLSRLLAAVSYQPQKHSEGQNMCSVEVFDQALRCAATAAEDAPCLVACLALACQLSPEP